MKYIYILSLLILPKLYGQVGIGVEEPQALLDVESMLIRGQLISPNPSGTENTYYKILNNGYPGWDHLPQPVDFSGSILIKDKIIMESSTGLLISNITATTNDSENSNFNSNWKMIEGLKTSFIFEMQNNSISAQFQTLASKYSNPSSGVSFACGFFVRKTPEKNPNSTTGYKLKVIRPEVLIGPNNAFKTLTVSGLITKDGNNQAFQVGQSYDIAVACRGRNVDGPVLRIGRSVTSPNEPNSNDETRNLLTPANIKSTFIVEQYQNP
ncbi:hypothetical protein [Faecalibacter macacae]|uniref:Uncharacterized protein n=1 Tax=Faecalibacter macacae TaxID=1859289 RepID=A0A3L9M3D1_9FLAO|nr:hypothetical protein [Faecalibacter macacae]RLZ06476.1 hypothetical protein EAH69_13410 [Faecalibacter macacae]